MGSGAFGWRAAGLAIGPQLLDVGPAQDHLEVEPIKQGAAEFSPIALALGFATVAGPFRVALPAAGAG